jgi:class 3 adenylate cyclase/tetratricopeptide (TPR) repeat protein
MPVLQEEAEAAQAQERKVVSVLFADLADSTELAARLDPERFREVMAEFYRMASDEVVSLRGRTEKYVGDAVMAVFGLPHAHDDDALRAVRAGISIRDRVGRLGEPLGLERSLAVRVGVNTGPVAATTAPAGDFLVSGIAVNLAARLQQAAQPGEVLVGDLTWQLTRHAAEFGPARSIPAKGFAAEVSACPVRALSPRSSRRTIPLVGRRRELSLLTDTFERAREAGRAHLVTLIGEPGIGKTRLVEELLAGIPDGSAVLLGRASEFGEDVAFAPLADMIRRRLGVETETDPEAVRKVLEDTIEGCCDPSESDQVAARLGLLLGLGEESGPGNPYRAAEIRAGVSGYIEGLARTGPVVMVVDDLHLARPALLQVLEEVAREGRRLPLLMVAVGREDLLRNRPDWAAGLPDTLTLRLDTLSFREARDLAQGAGESLDENTARRVAEHAGGNPFFIVETTGMLLHERSEEPHGGPSIEHLLPPTVQAVVASRIDHLPERARQLFRTASVFPGNAFHETKLALLADVDPSLLRTLEEEELIVRDEDRPGRWRFRHELLREVAYESVTKRDRRRLHEAVAAGLEREGQGVERHAQQVAYHLEEAARAALDLDPSDREAAGRAERALHRAGDLARWRMESRVAIDLYERALAMAGSEEDWGQREALVLAGMGEARYWLGEYEAAEATLRRAIEVGGEEAGPTSLAKRFLADIALNIHGDPDRADELFEGALRAARALDNPWAIARTLLMAAWVPYWRGQIDRAREMFEEALRIARQNPDGDRWGEARALTSLASLAGSRESPEKALQIADRALALGREMRDPFTVAVAQERRSSSLRARWELDEALRCSEEAVRIYRDLGARWELASSLGDRGTIHRLAGRLDQAEEDLRESLRLCRELGDRILVLWTTSELGMVRAMRGDLEEAAALARDPGVEALAGGPGDRSAMPLLRALVALAQGDQEEARRHAREVLEAELGSVSQNNDAVWTWWASRLFDEDFAGGERAVEDARRHLEGLSWERALREPDLIRDALVPVG